MKRMLTVGALLVLLCAPAAAWSEDAGDWEPPEPPERDVEIPVLEVEVPQHEVEVPEGIYRVTEVYVRDVVTVEGPLTTYETETITWSPGSYARELETVGTGSASALDGAAFNGRLTLSDGRPVAGTFYENFVWTDAGFAPVSVVFFQDDAELRRAAAAPPPVPEPAGLVLAPVDRAPTVIGSAPAGSAPDAPDGAAAFAPPQSADRDGPAPGAAGVPPAPAAPPLPPAPAPPVSPVGSVAPAVGGPAAARVEVLRGRRAVLWPRAQVDGQSAIVLAWRLVSGEASAATAAGSGAAPFVARWDRLAPPGGTYLLRFALQVEVPGDRRPREIEARVEVAVLSPALAR